MHLLTDELTWVGGYLDVTPLEGMLRIEVHRQVALLPVEDQFFVRDGQVAMVVNYLRSLGIRRVLRKIRSRRSESVRNDAWVSAGIGSVEGEGRLVAFVASTGPRGADRVVVPEAMCRPFDDGPVPVDEPGHWVCRRGDLRALLSKDALADLRAVAGWRPAEGPPAGLPTATWSEVVSLLTAPRDGLDRAPARPGSAPVLERIEPQAQSSVRPGFHCFGYGQYAKTQVIPGLAGHLDLLCVHEIDPMQIGPVEQPVAHGWDTSPRPRPDEPVANASVAGYHHTHAPLAVELIERGARHVIIEKPLATTREQIDALLDALERHGGAKVHTAFQRRYSPLNLLLREDLGPGPISMAATVFEVPLPARHWYRWPVVGGPVVSNGCHWIDHFLFLNDYAEPVRLDARDLGSQLVLSIELESGASCSISLRHEGSPRLGVRDSCTFWHGDASATIEDGHRYVAERGHRVLRRRSVHRYRALEDMYQELGRRVAVDAPGDDLRSLSVSARTVLDLADRLAADTAQRHS